MNLTIKIYSQGFRSILAIVVAISIISSNFGGCKKSFINLRKNFLGAATFFLFHLIKRMEKCLKCPCKIFLILRIFSKTDVLLKDFIKSSFENHIIFTHCYWLNKKQKLKKWPDGIFYFCKLPSRMRLFSYSLEYFPMLF